MGTTRLFVNAYSTSFNYPWFVEQFLDRGLPLPPWRIVFELVERLDPESAGVFHEKASKLFRAGYDFAIDDLGAPGTCGRILLQFHTAYAKTDRTFVNDCLRLGKWEVLKGYLREAADIAGRVIIEGVEEDWGVRDLGSFYERGVAYAQGFKFGRPLPADQVCASGDGEPRAFLEQVWKKYPAAA